MEIKEVEHLAELSKLEFSPKELEDFKKDFESLINLADVIKNADIVGERKLNIVDMNDLRDDIPKENTPTDIIIKNAPQRRKNSFVVPKIME